MENRAQSECTYNIKNLLLWCFLQTSALDSPCSVQSWLSVWSQALKIDSFKKKIVFTLHQGIDVHGGRDFTSCRPTWNHSIIEIAWQGDKKPFPVCLICFVPQSRLTGWHFRTGLSVSLKAIAKYCCGIHLTTCWFAFIKLWLNSGMMLRSPSSKEKYWAPLVVVCLSHMTWGMEMSGGWSAQFVC